MPLLFRIVTLAAALTFAGCASFQPLTRGVHEGEVFSSARPELGVSAALPHLASFRGKPMIITVSSPAAPQVWGAVYGDRNRMAVVAMAQAPTGWEWLFPPQSVAGRRAQNVRIDGREFSAQTWIVPARRDPFASLVFEGPDPDASWLTSTFTTLADFQEFKVILEYRELLEQDVLDKPLTDSAIAEFESRARQVFSVSQTIPEFSDAFGMGAVDGRHFTRFLGRLDTKNVRAVGTSW